MFSLCRPRSPERWLGVVLLGAVVLPLSACDKPKDDVSTLPAANSGPSMVAVTKLFPGGETPPPEDPHNKDYAGNPTAIAEGSRLFDWYNCSGCHFHGAGGIGPAFMDSDWIYGGRLDQIYASIYQGRPNGMPTWAAKIPETQIWEIAAYIKSLETPPTASGGDVEAPHVPAPVPASDITVPVPPARAK